MFKNCPKTNGNGEHYIQWALHYFGECIYTPRGEASLIIGLISIFCFAFAQFPQIWKNFKLKQLPGLSPIFILLWLLGDASNLLGCILSNQLPTQLYQAVYFVCVDFVTFSQILWILYKNRRSESENTIAEVQVVEPNNPNVRMFGVLPVFLPQLLFSAAKSSSSPVAPLTTIPGLETPTEIIGYAIGCVSACCYISSRIPQIIKNYRRKSTSGLSMWMFCCTSSGNILYTISLVLMFTGWQPVVLHLPWLLGAAVPLLFDILILSQFIKYRNNQYQLLDVVTVNTEDPIETYSSENRRFDSENRRFFN